VLDGGRNVAPPSCTPLSWFQGACSPVEAPALLRAGFEGLGRTASRAGANDLIARGFGAPPMALVVIAGRGGHHPHVCWVGSPPCRQARSGGDSRMMVVLPPSPGRPMPAPIGTFACSRGPELADWLRTRLEGPAPPTKWPQHSIHRGGDGSSSARPTGNRMVDVGGHQQPSSKGTCPAHPSRELAGSGQDPKRCLTGLPLRVRSKDGPC